jgi:peptidoglycan/LPS O-acetylase OafA/YrhL
MEHVMRAVPYRPDIDGLRALAVLSVIAYHLNGRWLPGGFTGVDIFFVISGYVVTASLAHAESRSIGRFLLAFYARRLARIIPALVTVLVISAIAATLFIPRAWLSDRSELTALFAFAGLSNWSLQNSGDAYFAPRAEFNPYTHTWSLGVEEQFYLVAPLLLFGWIRAWNRSSRIGVWIWGCALAVLALASLIGAAWASPRLPSLAFYSIAFRFWELGAGALLFVLTRDQSGQTAEAEATRAKQIAKRAAPWLGAALIGISFAYARAHAFPWPWALPAVAGTALLIWGMQNSHGALNRFFSSSIAVWIGKRSYSLYLWHWPVFVLLRWTVGLESLVQYAIGVALTVVAASASFRFVEVPLRYNKRIQRFPAAAQVALFLLLPIAGWAAAKHIFKHQAEYSLSVVTKNGNDWHAGASMPANNAWKRHCAVNMQPSTPFGGLEFHFEPQNCPHAENEPRVFVLGDSHALAYMAMYDQYAAETGRAVTLRSFVGCPFIDFERPMHIGRSPGCAEFTRGVVERILAEAKPGDIVFLPSLRIRRFSDQWASFGITDMYAYMYAPEMREPRRAALDDAKQWIEKFTDKKLRVVFEAPKPVFRSPPFRCADWFNQSNPICVTPNSQPRFEFERLRGPVLESMRVLAASNLDVKIWDPLPTLCASETCSPQLNGRPLYFDGDHVSAYGNFLLYPTFRSLMSTK